jgi:transposase
MSELIELSNKERRELESLRMLDVERRQYQRILALLLLDEGASVEEIAEQLFVPRRTIYDWINRFNQRSDLSIRERIQDAVRSGRPATAKGVIDPVIDKIIDSDPRDYGYNSTVWTAELLRRYLSKYHHHDVSLRSISYALVRLEIGWKLPRYVLSRQDPYWRQAKGGLKRASGRTNER